MPAQFSVGNIGLSGDLHVLLLAYPSAHGFKVGPPSTAHRKAAFDLT